MPIEIQSTKPVKPDGIVQFTFAQPVIHYTIGISAFKMTYGDDDHWIQSLSISIQPDQNSAAAAVSKQVTAKIVMTLQDCSGNSIDTVNSEVWPVCIAVTGSPEPATGFGSVTGVPTDTAQPVDVPSAGDGYSIATCFQSGFNLTFTPTDHQILQANALVGFPSSNQISATAGMNDARGNHVDIAKLDAGYIVSAYATPGIVAHETNNQTGKPFQVSLKETPKAAVALIRGWTVAFPSVHNLKTLAVGCFDNPTCAGDSVTIPSCYANMNDASGNTQDDSRSSCDMVIIATT